MKGPTSMDDTPIRDLEPMSSLSRSSLPVALPPAERFEQDVEWCVARVDGEWQEVRFHDYGRLYEVEGLYERIFYDILQCNSPATVCGLLARELEEAGVGTSGLRVLDLGAGNGMVAAELMALGASEVYGVDIIPEAAEAAERDRPNVYADYLVTDMTELDPDERALLADADLNGLLCVAALGFGDIPPAAFANAYNLVQDGGWVAFNIKEDFLSGEDRSGFQELIATVIEDGTMRVHVQTRYRHRNATNGEPIYYVALVGRKDRDIPDHLYD